MNRAKAHSGLGAIAIAVAMGGCAPDGGEAGEQSLVSSGGGGASPSGGSSAGGASPAATGSFSGGAAPMFDYGDAAPPSTTVDAGCEGIRDTREVAPNVLVVVDRSGSMAFEGVDRWTPAVDALGGLTSSLDDRIRFGLSVFPSVADGSCSTGESRIAPDLGTASALEADLRGPAAPASGGGTPIASTLRAAGDMLSGLEGTSYVLLLTDGGPNCNAQADATTCTCTRSPEEYCRGGDIGGGALVNPTPILCLDDADAVVAVGELASAGIRTFVIGYDTSDWAATLDAMAVAGDTGRDAHFPVSDGAALTAALGAIGARVATCTYQLSEEPPDERYVSVTLDDALLLPVGLTGGSSGWRLTEGTVVELVGDACATLSDGATHTVSIVRECRPVIR